MLEDPTCHYMDLFLKKRRKLLIGPIGISYKEDIILFSVTVFKAKEGYALFGFVIMLNGVIVDAVAIQGPKVISLKEATFSCFVKGLEEWFC